MEYCERHSGYLVALITSQLEKSSEFPVKGHSISKWKVRWFELRHNELYCYADCSKQTTIAIIALSSVVISEVAVQGRTHCFKLASAESSCTLQATNAKEASEWLSVLRARSFAQPDSSNHNFLLYEVELKTSPPPSPQLQRRDTITTSQEILSYFSATDSCIEEQNKILKAMIISQQKKYRKLENKLRSLVDYHRHEKQMAFNTKSHLEIWINDLNSQLELVRSRVASMAEDQKIQSDARDVSRWFINVSMR